MERGLEYDNGKLREYWDGIIDTNWHFHLNSPTISDRYYKFLVERFFRKWAPAKPGLKVLKLDMYNEATTTEYANYYLERGSDVAFVEISNTIAKHAWKVMRHKGLCSFANPIQGDFRKLPFKDCSFDVSCSFGSIEHTPQWYESLAEQIRVVKSGGTVIVGVPNLFNVWLRAPLCNLLHKFNVLDKFTNYEIHFTPKKLLTACKNLGLKEVKVSGYHLFPKLLRWLDLQSKYQNENFNKIYGKFIEPLLSATAKVESKETRLNLLAEMLVTVAKK